MMNKDKQTTNNMNINIEKWVRSKEDKKEYIKMEENKRV